MWPVELFVFHPFCHIFFFLHIVCLFFSSFFFAQRVIMTTNDLNLFAPSTPQQTKKTYHHQSRRHHLLPSEEGEEEARRLLISVLLNDIDWWRLEISSYTCHLCPSTAWASLFPRKMYLYNQMLEVFFCPPEKKKKKIVNVILQSFGSSGFFGEMGGGVFFPSPLPLFLGFPPSPVNPLRSSFGFRDF